MRWLTYYIAFQFEFSFNWVLYLFLYFIVFFAFILIFLFIFKFFFIFKFLKKKFKSFLFFFIPATHVQDRMNWSFPDFFSKSSDATSSINYYGKLNWQLKTRV